MTSCELNQIFLGEVAAVQNYGAFIRIPGCTQQGLIHKSQVSAFHVDDVGDVLQRGERVWCKVISISDEGKISLSMKLVNQGNGTDLDPNGVQLQKDEQKRKSVVHGQRKAIQLQAVLNTTCGKCGTHGHLSSDCFMSPDGKTYELLPEIEEEKDTEQKGATLAVVADRNDDKIKKHKSSKRSKKKSKKSKTVSASTTDSSDDDENLGKKSAKKRTKEKKKKKEKKKSRSSSLQTSGSKDEGKVRKRKSSDHGTRERCKKKC
ncbi:zinc finger CCHC domain-containing protein 17-like [Athalia rosae]|uniref:zinc finger CCHC domain-containing protein 17-like n=1 Tax=Athalia rosae TaxID=37344 RepID=UPI0020345A45|nr:zinc finger CCHC domain-containing protein 17-like [Athalia rosae]XP_012255124.2 zinc finger CCHC domain-containing protein 17-like [Athalia rosae]